MASKSKKMMEIEAVIEAANARISSLSGKRRGLMEFKPSTENGKVAQGQASEKLAGEIQELHKQVESSRAELEIATVTFLASDETPDSDATIPV